MVLTVEPGIYFNDYLLDEAFQDPVLSGFLVKERIDRDFRGFGGVRIEDEIIIHEDRTELISILPRSVEEIEAYMSEDSGEKK